MRLLLFILFFPIFHSTAQANFESKIEKAVTTMECPDPDESQPVRVNAQVVVDQDSIAIIIKCRIAMGWHIYDYVSPNLPYIASKPVIQLPDDISSCGSWVKTEPSATALDPGVLIFEKEAVYIHKALRRPDAKENGIIKAGLYFQTCNIRQCLPPVEKVFTLSY